MEMGFECGSMFSCVSGVSVQGHAKIRTCRKGLVSQGVGRKIPCLFDFFFSPLETEPH